MGNALTMSIAFVPFTTPVAAEFTYDLPFDFISDTGLVLVNDHFAWSMTLGKWREDVNNIGVVVAGSVTVADLEAAIADATALATLTTPDASPTKAVNAVGMLAAGIAAAAGFAGGTYGVPTGESLKLTGLAAMVGVQSGTRRLPAAQVSP